MRKIIVGGTIGLLALSLSGHDADARRRKHHKHKLVQVVTVPPSVFDTGVSEAPPYAAVVSPTQAYAASTYTWEAAKIFPPVRVEWTKAEDLSSMDQQVLKQGQKPVITRLGVMWGLLGAACGMLLGLSCLAWAANKEWVRLT